MPYTHFRLIAYEVPTATYSGGGGGVISGWDPGRLCPEVARLRIPNNLNGLSADATNRLRRMAGVIDEAERSLQALGDNNNTLKIFMAPEFYFRPQVLGPTYAHNTYPDMEAMQIMGALDQMVEHADFQHWLFVFGTVMWNTSSDDTQPTLYRNSAVYKRGGVWAPRLQIGVIEKKLPSGIDGVPAANPMFDPILKPIFEGWRIRRQRVFDSDAISFGLEICLDHADHPDTRTLKNTLADWQQNERSFRQVKLHLLSAGGMPTQTGSVAAKVGGYILRCDGLYSPTGQSEVRQVTAYDVKNRISGAVTRKNAHFFVPGEKSDAVLAANEAPESTRDLFGAKLVQVPGLNYKVFGQRIVYYPVLGLPA